MGTQADWREIDEASGEELDRHAASREEAVGGRPLVVCPACGWHHHRERVEKCDRCGETPSSIAAAEADHEATQRADRWL